LAARRGEQQQAADDFRAARAEREAIARLKERYATAERAARTRRETAVATEIASIRAARRIIGIDASR
jgi:flagellar biosynthesis chaperone FliJ